MPKNKQKKDTDKKFIYNNEVTGIILILISIIGICRYGPVGRFISSFAVFLVGTIYPVLLIMFLLLGLYLIVKREAPNYFSSKLLGLYTFILALLIFLHIDYVTMNDLKGVTIFKETIDNVLLTFKNVDAISNTGGGIFGALLSFVFVSLFSIEGTKIVVGGLVVLGFILFLNVSIYDTFIKIKSGLKKLFTRKDKKNKDSDASEEEVDDKIVVSSINELTHIKPLSETSNDALVKEEVISSTSSSVNKNYRLPPLTLLKDVKNINNTENVKNAKVSMELLAKVLNDFEIVANIVKCNIGPTVTQYELEIKAGTKVSKLLSVQREIALALSAKEIRIQAPIPGKNTIGVEIPNKVNAPVSFKEVVSYLPEINEKTLLTVALGKDIMAKIKYAEINATPHLLIAGSTGSGKSVCMNCIIASILMRARPDQVKLVMVDPKKVELGMYNGIPHLLCPVVTDPKKASIALQNIVAEMERRYGILEKTHNKNIEMYNKFCEKNSDYQKLPYIVVIIDELADLMLVAAKEVEDSILRITQMARAAGIHLIVATQRPSTDVITGVVKANIPSRISFAVSSSIDSRTILDMTGAEKLLGKGDMLFKPMGENTPIRIQGAYVSEEELQAIVDFVTKEQGAEYDNSLTEEPKTTSAKDDYQSEEEYDDPLYTEIASFAVRTGKISASLIQRKYRLGYNRAARIIDLLEERGIIGPQNGSKPREVLVKLDDQQ
ncbi:MAG: DNA translocase FtsK [Tenericutes bacterium]|nr:DNA translocase FtsK [Mycoplasmatota bacterium]